MRHTLKAVFENRSDAQHVLDELLASGYTRADTALGAAAGAEHDEGLGASVRHTLTRIFGPKRHDGVMAPPADAARGRHIVIFATESEPEAERAAGIIGSFHPAGVEEVHEQSAQLTDGAYLPGVAAMGTVYPPGTEPGALQFRAHEDSRYFGTQNAEAPPTSTFQETMGTAMPWGHPDEEAAYRYGKEMRASGSYLDHSWDEAEPALQSGWERRHAGGESPAWDRIRTAVRRGWDRVKSR
jgi:hypothetical protein